MADAVKHFEERYVELVHIGAARHLTADEIAEKDHIVFATGRQPDAYFQDVRHAHEDKAKGNPARAQLAEMQKQRDGMIAKRNAGTCTAAEHEATGERLRELGNQIDQVQRTVNGFDAQRKENKHRHLWPAK